VISSGSSVVRYFVFWKSCCSCLFSVVCWMRWLGLEWVGV